MDLQQMKTLLDLLTATTNAIQSILQSGVVGELADRIGGDKALVIPATSEAEMQAKFYILLNLTDAGEHIERAQALAAAICTDDPEQIAQALTADEEADIKAKGGV